MACSCGQPSTRWRRLPHEIHLKCRQSACFHLVMMEWWELGLPFVIDFRISIVNSLRSLQDSVLLCSGRHRHQGASYLCQYKILIRSIWLWISHNFHSLRPLISLKKCVIIFHVPSPTGALGWVSGWVPAQNRQSIFNCRCWWKRWITVQKRPNHTGPVSFFHAIW